MPAAINETRTENLGANPTIEIRSLRIGEDATTFRTLNEDWITRFFHLEEKDRLTLGDPENTILRIGGSIFMVYADGTPVGCVALVPMGNGVFELAKMAVSPQFQGLGIGRRLLEYTVAQVRQLGIKQLFLGSSTKLPNAVHLYESVGFSHVSPERRPNLAYSRADVFMEMTL